MCGLSCGDGDTAAKCGDIRALLGEGVAVTRGLCLLCSDGKAEPAGTEDAGLPDIFVVFRMRIVFCRCDRDVPSCGDVYVMIRSNIRCRKGCVTFCRDVDILSRDIRRVCGI